jgi:predicted naringenin-chalcone synthase
MNNLNQPRITAVATATPPDRFTQEEVLQMAGYTRPIARDIFMNSDIDYRYLYVNPATDHPGEDLDKLHRRYREGAALIARQAAERSLEKAGLTTDDVDCILVCSCTGYLCPDLSTVLVKEMGLASRVQRGALLGLGCAGAMPTADAATRLRPCPRLPRPSGADGGGRDLLGGVLHRRHPGDADR